MASIMSKRAQAEPRVKLIAVDTSIIPGWGVDADPENDPTWPMRDRLAEDGRGMDWLRPPLQGRDIEVLQSIEYTHRPAVFGTSSPPSGLSGQVRRVAFKFSESRWIHWLLLMGADRINVVEGVVQDLAGGKIPNLYKEMGLGAAWRYDRAAAVRRTAAITVTFLALGTAFLTLRLRRRRA